jgi:hypothetical protein
MQEKNWDNDQQLKTPQANRKICTAEITQSLADYEGAICLRNTILDVKVGNDKIEINEGCVRNGHVFSRSEGNGRKKVQAISKLIRRWRSQETSD